MHLITITFDRLLSKANQAQLSYQRNDKLIRKFLNFLILIDEDLWTYLS